jgi:hypothetical protein
MSERSPAAPRALGEDLMNRHSKPLEGAYGISVEQRTESYSLSEFAVLHLPLNLS